MRTASRIKLAATVASVVRASSRVGAPSLPERMQAVPRLVRATLDGTYAGSTLRRLSLVAAAVVYVASPVDLIPEAVLPVLGAADDAVVLAWAIRALFDETDRYLAWEMGQGVHRPGGGRSAASRVTVPGTVSGPSQAPGEQAATRPAAPPDGWAPLPADPGQDGPRRDRDVTGAAAPGRVAGRISAAAARVPRPSLTYPAPGRGGRRPAASRPASSRLPEGVRQAATDYVLESVRKRLER
jgi:uncharacterized membrane protein YkvA (DUF1232 family)